MLANQKDALPRLLRSAPYLSGSRLLPKRTSALLVVIAFATAQLFRGAGSVREPIRPVIGPGRFQWNTGGWWGAALGATAWMVPTAIILMVNGQTLLSLLPVTGFLLVNAIAAVLWRRRDRVPPFRAIMHLLVSLAVCTPVVWVGVAMAGTEDSLAHMNWPESRLPGLGALFIAPALMVLFVYMEYSCDGRTRSGHDRPQNPA